MACNDPKYFTFNEKMKEIVDFFLADEEEIFYMGVKKQPLN